MGTMMTELGSFSRMGEGQGEGDQPIAAAGCVQSVPVGTRSPKVDAGVIESPSPRPSPIRERERSRSCIAAGLLLAACLSIVACGSGGANEGEDYGNLLASPGGLLVLEEEHPTGFGRADCQTCHEVRNSHFENRTGLANCQDVASGTDCIDLDQINEIIRQQGEQSCMQCHGDNGARP
jgi:hypothetical protein